MFKYLTLLLILPIFLSSTYPTHASNNLSNALFKRESENNSDNNGKIRRDQNAATRNKDRSIERKDRINAGKEDDEMQKKSNQSENKFEKEFEKMVEGQRQKQSFRQIIGYEDNDMSQSRKRKQVYVNRNAHERLDKILKSELLLLNEQREETKSILSKNKDIPLSYPPTHSLPSFSALPQTFPSISNQNPNNRPTLRLLQQSFIPPTPTTPIRLINISEFLANIPKSTLQSIPAPKSTSQAFSQLFDKFNSQISSKLTQQNIAFTPFPPYSIDNSTNQIIQNNRTMVSYSASFLNPPPQKQDTSNLPDVIPIRPMFLPADYQIVSTISPTNTNNVQILTAPSTTSQLSTQQPLPITPTTIPADFSTQSQPRINPQSNILNAFRSIQIGNATHYIIQQADYNLDQNLLGIILQLKDQKKSDFTSTTNMTTIYAEFVFISNTSITNYNIIFKNSTRYIIAGIQLPFKILNYNVLSPNQINPLCERFDGEGNCSACSKNSYLAEYGICVAVNVRCEEYSKLTGVCTGCYEGYQLTGGDCVVKNSVGSRNSGFKIEGCAREQGGRCVQCQQRYYNENGMCRVVSRLCVTWDERTGKCLSCYQGYRLGDGECKVGGLA